MGVRVLKSLQESLIGQKLFHSFISRPISVKDKTRRFIVNLRSPEVSKAIINLLPHSSTKNNLHVQENIILSLIVKLLHKLLMVMILTLF